MPIGLTLVENNIPIKIWAEESEVEPLAIAQLRNTARLPFVFKHVCAMPDCHLGKGAVVGSVIATKGAISPAAVGVDIGCGMMAVKTALDWRKVTDNLPQLRNSIERSVPLGRNGNAKIAPNVESWEGWGRWNTLSTQNKDLRWHAERQLGSLGGGNHFIELCLDTEKAVWVMLHSGSRHIGKEIADRHINKAKSRLAELMVELPDPELAWVVQGTEEFRSYMNDLQWCQDYALQNRIEMMSRVLKDLAHGVNNKEPVDPLLSVNCHHNYAEEETHFGEDVFVTRKGAVRARVGDYGIIPGSMGAKSFIVRGKGNPDSFMSCSHGAGRKHSRAKARELFTLEDFAAQTQGVECRKDRGVLDEIPSAYKDIERVMENQSDLVEVVAELKQVLCVKG